MVRSALAIIVGYILMGVAVLLATILAARLILGVSMLDTAAQPTILYLVVNVAYSLVFAAVGGYMAAVVARRKPMWHGAALAALMLVVGLVSANTSKGISGGQPAWYPPVITVGGAAFAVVGSWLHAVRARSQRPRVAET